MTMRLERYGAIEGIREIDRGFARFICEHQCGECDDALVDAVVLVSRLSGDRHAALDLAKAAGRDVAAVLQLDGKTGIELPGSEEWKERLRSCSRVVGIAPKAVEKPLILDQDLLYLNRFWHYERIVAEHVRKMTGQSEEVPEKAWDLLKRLFFDRKKGFWQYLAAIATLRSRITVISGGPGTGKTFTAARILALHLALKPDMEVRLAAPTGKAAQRMSEAIREAKKGLDLVENPVREIPEEASTIHRLLGYHGGSREFRFNAKNKLPIDMLIVDEASMVDLPMFARLFEALPDDAHLVLLGDKDQLASVETGSVFTDLTAPEYLNLFTDDFINLFNGLEKGLERKLMKTADKSHILNNRAIKLEHSFRFEDKSGIGFASHLINVAGDQDDAAAVMDLLKNQRLNEHNRQRLGLTGKNFSASQGFTDISWQEIKETGLLEALRQSIKSGVIKHLSEYMKMAEKGLGNDDLAKRVLSALMQFRILTPVNNGPFGVEGLNTMVKKALNIPEYTTRFAGRPIMVLHNDYGLNLMNGDVGVMLKDRDNAFRAWFPAQNNAVRSFPPAFLPEHITAFAMTVHKSQGSEFDNVLMVLPENDNPVITRELLYTGITRAKARVEVWATPTVFSAGVLRQTQRTSGLRKRLDG